MMTGNDKRRDVCLPPRFCCRSLQEIPGTDAGMWNTMKTLATDVALKGIGGFPEIMERSDEMSHRSIAAFKATSKPRNVRKMGRKGLLSPSVDMRNRYHQNHFLNIVILDFINLYIRFVYLYP